MTENELFGTISDFPTMEENEMNQSFPEDSSLHLSDLNASNASTNTTREESSIGTINDFPTMEENEMNQSFPEDSSLHLSNLNASNALTNTTLEESSIGGKRKTKKHRKSKRTFKKSGSKSKKSKTKKHRKTLKRKHHKKKRGGFIGDNGTDMERYGETNPYSVERDSDPRY
jgi:hypothetical protein